MWHFFSLATVGVWSAAILINYHAILLERRDCNFSTSVMEHTLKPKWFVCGLLDGRIQPQPPWDGKMRNIIRYQPQEGDLLWSPDRIYLIFDGFTEKTQSKLVVEFLISAHMRSTFLIMATVARAAFDLDFLRKLNAEYCWQRFPDTSLAKLKKLTDYSISSYLKHVAFVSSSVAGRSSLISGHFWPVPRGSCTIRLVRTIVSRDCPVTSDLFCTVQFDQPDTKQLRGSMHRSYSLGLSMWAQYL